MLKEGLKNIQIHVGQSDVQPSKIEYPATTF